MRTSQTNTPRSPQRKQRTGLDFYVWSFQWQDQTQPNGRVDTAARFRESIAAPGMMPNAAALASHDLFGGHSLGPPRRVVRHEEARQFSIVQAGLLCRQFFPAR